MRRAVGLGLVAAAAGVALSCGTPTVEVPLPQPSPFSTPSPIAIWVSPSPEPSPLPPSPAPPDPIALYRAASFPELDHLFNLGVAVQGVCTGAATPACRQAFLALLNSSASATADFNTRPYPPCMKGVQIALASTAVGYHNASIQGLGSIDSGGRWTYQPALATIADEEHTIKDASLFDTPLGC